MEWKILATTAATIFAAELGDKTQLAAIAAVAATRRPLEVFLGAALGLVAVTAIGVAGGEALARAVPLSVIKKIAGAAFVVIGGLILADWI